MKHYIFSFTYNKIKYCMYNLRTIRDPLLKQIANALPPDLLWLIYELAVQAPQPRYHLRSGPR